MTTLAPAIHTRPPLRALVVSDLHFEFHADAGRSFVADLRDDVDVVLLAGDLTDSSGLTDALDVVARRFTCPIVYVHGNHELYGSNREAVVAATARAAKEHANLSWLDNGVTVIAGRRILRYEEPARADANGSIAHKSV